jgi:NTE family protein
MTAHGPRNVRRGLALGCGGTVGGAWQIGALAVIEDQLGWDARTAEVIVGTSAGATAAAMLGAGISVKEMVAGQRGDPSARESLRRFFTDPPAALPAIPFGLPAPRLSPAGLHRRMVLPALAGLLPAGRTDPSLLDALVDDLVPGGDWVAHPNTWVVATRLSTGERTVFGRSDAPSVPLRQAVRASWAIPGWYPPVEIAGERYVDGGVASTASADALGGMGLDEVIVVAPMASDDGSTVGGLGGLVEGMLRRPMSAVLDAEIASLQATGTRVVRVHPSSTELKSMGPNFMNPRRRIAALESALGAGVARGAAPPCLG